MKFTARLVAPLAVGALFKFAALGWALLPGNSMLARIAFRDGVAFLAGMRGKGRRRRGIVGLHDWRCWSRLLWSALVLYRKPVPGCLHTDKRSRPFTPDAGWGESALLCRRTCWWPRSQPPESVPCNTMDVRLAILGTGSGWSTEFWLGTDWEPRADLVGAWRWAIGCHRNPWHETSGRIQPPGPGRIPRKFAGEPSPRPPGRRGPGQVARQLVHLGGAIAGDCGSGVERRNGTRMAH